LRIVSVAEETEKPLSAWQANTKPVIPRGYWRSCVLLPPRDQLYERINLRFDNMVDDHGLDEVRKLLKRDLPRDLPVMRAIGVKTVLEHFSGKHDLDTGIELAKRDTRRFAKRQMTWFRGQAPNWPKIENNSDKEAFKRQIF
jgi:tRNA dimethylallyltransferase